MRVSDFCSFSRRGEEKRDRNLPGDHVIICLPGIDRCSRCHMQRTSTLGLGLDGGSDEKCPCQWLGVCFQEGQCSVWGSLLQYIFWVINTTICQLLKTCFSSHTWFSENLVTVTPPLVPFFAPVLTVIFLLPQSDHGTCSCTAFFHLVLVSSCIHCLLCPHLIILLVVNSSLVDLFGFYFFTQKPC